MTRYAESTSVTSGASRGEIERTLRRYSATGFMYGWDESRAVVGFVIDGRQVRFLLPMADPEERRFTHTAGRQVRRTPEAAHKEWEQSCRQSWRALALVVKAKLEAVAAGIVTLDQEFGMHFVLPDGRTVADHVLPRMIEAIETGRVSPMLPALTAQSSTL